MAAVKPLSYHERNLGRPLDEVITELHERVVALEAYISWDEALRADNPALQDLYEKFQITKKLAE